MTDPVFIHPIPEPVAVGDRFRLTGAEAKHASVKRLEVGEGLVVTDGAARAVQSSFLGDATVEVTDILKLPVPHPRVTVVQAIPKSDRAELAVDLAVQAGADRIVPWAARRAIAKWDGKEAKAHGKWENAARAAAKQSRRLRIPEVTQLVRSPQDVARELGLGETGAVRVLVLHEEATEPLPGAVNAAVNAASANGSEAAATEIALVVGPEGGISPEELAEFERLGATPVRLGPEVLRTATAAAVALGAIGAVTDRWR
ncbi:MULTISPECIES: 16S rRNA (uracil(1498)-N(3))-methyltransferase [unclassified Corynebacterium]|uniref:16S rRNA (uracil(1498)-N(3))-methyltransferase n=1 Tax=unclassified Corynebacterium TaxID=2624378 RepID=UPI001EF57F68|nr:MULTISPECIES: 16S rRNA (uracil(1498)-N(3))-methyltransferase [unclassified Corynebacterium]MCG7258798.1 16S rRNA (uracil(1498)-N(3))-methyltransferase [Corynebacterium sp. ACRQK]MCG7263263.1 16S rRNA (uracil(1498)-N(3))-methyltransferase [Corynebacterium sp. ACRQL]